MHGSQSGEASEYAGHTEGTLSVLTKAGFWAFSFDLSLALGFWALVGPQVFLSWSYMDLGPYWT